MNRDVRLIVISLMVWGIGEGTFYYFQPIYLQQLGADPLRIGAILGAVGASMAVFHIPSGYLADRFGRRPLIWLSYIVGVIAIGMMALSSSLSFFVAGMLLYGLTFCLMAPLNSYVATARGKWTTGRAFMAVSAGFNFGMIIGPTLGGTIAEHYGLRSVFYVATVIVAISTGIILFISPQTIEQHTTGRKRFDFLHNNRYLQFLIVVFIATFAAYIPQPLSQNFLLNERGLTLGTIGRLTSMAGLGTTVINIVFGYLDTKLGYLLAQVCVGLFSALLWLGNGIPWYTLAYFFLGGYKTFRSLGSAQVRTLVHSSSMGLAFGFTDTISSTAVILAPPLAGLLYHQHPEWVYIASIGAIAIALLAGVQYAPGAANEIQPGSIVTAKEKGPC